MTLEKLIVQITNQKILVKVISVLVSKKEEFEKWAKQFIAIQDSHVREFLDSIGDLSLHEMKCKFSEKYQDRIGFSYSLLTEAKIIKDIHMQTVELRDYGFGFKIGSGFGTIGGYYGYSSNKGCGHDDGYPIGNSCSDDGCSNGYLSKLSYGYSNGDGSGLGPGRGYGFCYGKDYLSGSGDSKCYVKENKFSSNRRRRQSKDEFAS